jgi:hypothetical protein
MVGATRRVARYRAARRAAPTFRNDEVAAQSRSGAGQMDFLRDHQDLFLDFSHIPADHRIYLGKFYVIKFWARRAFMTFPVFPNSISIQTITIDSCYWITFLFRLSS